MTILNAYPAAVLFQFPDEDPCCRDAAVLVSLGEGAAVLTERWSDYAQSLPESNWTGLLGKLVALPLTTETLLLHARRVPCVIAVSGTLADEGIQLIRRLIERGGHCTVVVDATTVIRPEWASVVRLPPHRSRDAQWAWGMRVYLDALLNRGLVCLDPSDVLACTENRLSQFTVVHSEDESRSIAGVERALQSLARRCDLGACDTFLLLFHTGPDVRLKEIHWGVQAFKNALRRVRDDDYLLMVGHLPHREIGFSISLMAGAAR